MKAGLFAAAMLAGAAIVPPAGAVRVNPDGHGQVLIYPYYTARSTASGNPFATALSVTNTSTRPKALKVRFPEGKAGAEVLSFNLFLDAHDSWTAGVIGAGAGAAVVSTDRSCATPSFSSARALGNAAYLGDRLGDSLARTYEGYVEIYEMATIEPVSALGRSIAHSTGARTPGTVAPACNDLPQTDVVPVGLSRPSGGLVGTASFINVNEGVDFSVNAVALSGWSDRIQWSGLGNATPNLTTVSPPVSAVVDSSGSGEILYLTRWDAGRDAVTAVLMAFELINDYSVEPQIKGATDWVLAMPTKPYYVNRERADAPFVSRSTPSDCFHCERIGEHDRYFPYCDREGQCDHTFLGFFGTPISYSLCGVAPVLTFTANEGYATASNVFQSSQFANLGLRSPWINGWLPLRLQSTNYQQRIESGSLRAPAGRTTAIDVATGAARTNLDVTYRGLPVVGFAATSYSTHGLPGVSPSILSIFGGQFVPKYQRRIEIAP